VGPLRGLSFDEIVDKYVLFKPNHTYYRHLPIDKFFGGFALSYLVLREVLTSLFKSKKY